MTISTQLLIVFLLLKIFTLRTTDNQLHVWVYLEPDVNEHISDGVDFPSLLEYNAEQHGVEISIDLAEASRDELGIFFETINSDHWRVSFMPPVDLTFTVEQSPVLSAMYTGYGLVFEPTNKEAWDIIAKLSIGLGTYVLGNCEAAIPIIQETQELASNAQIDFRSFYEVT
jgi:hypothetical protein